MELKALLLDMGGVVLQMGNEGGFPVERLDWRGREALLRLVRERGGQLGLEDLEGLLFAPWRREYERRRERGREAPWEPHLQRLRRAAGIAGVPDLELLEAWFRPYGEGLQPAAGAGEALAELKSLGLRLALVSNVPLPGELYRRVLGSRRLLEPFEALFFSYDCGTRKPSPALLRTALGALHATPAEAAIVGDRRESDIAAGRAAGTVTIWVRSEHAAGPAPDLEVPSLAAVPALLGRL